MPTRMLLPVALLQGLWIRRTTPRLPPAGGFARDGFHPGPEACGEWAGWLLDLWLDAERPGPRSATMRRP